MDKRTLRGEHHWNWKGGYIIGGYSRKKPIWAKNRKKLYCDYCRIYFWEDECKSKRKRKHFCSIKCYAKYRQEIMPIHMHPRWKGGITSLYRIIRNSLENKSWSKQVLERDNYTCQSCGVRSGCGHKILLHAHHKNKSFSQILQEFLAYYNQFSPIEDKETLARLAITYKPFWDVDNGITHCNKCHRKIEILIQKEKNEK